MELVASAAAVHAKQPRQMIDLYFYSDPVLPGESADFHVWTDNPDHGPFFGVMLWPTPIPEPASLVPLGLGALLLRRR